MKLELMSPGRKWDVLLQGMDNLLHMALTGVEGPVAGLDVWLKSGATWQLEREFQCTLNALYSGLVWLIHC